MYADVGIAENMYGKPQWCHNFLKEVDFFFLAIVKNLDPIVKKKFRP